MKSSTKEELASYAIYFLTAMLIAVIVYEIGYIKGMAEAHKTQLKEQIRLLEQRNEEIMVEQIKRELK